MLTVQEAATFLRIGINEAYLATRTGVIPAIRIGTTIRVPKDALLRRLTEAANVPSQ
jgi:excisionase family DNA binding protein